MSEEKKVRKKRQPVSEESKKFVCDVCGKKCANPQSLRMHKKWKHSGDSGEEKSFPTEERGSENKGEDKDDGWVPF